MKSSAKSNQYLALCIEQAALSPLRFRHGCVVVKGGKVIGRGHNSHAAAVHGSARAARNDAPLSLHAEMMAVDSALGAAGPSSIKRAADLPADTKSKRRRRAGAVQSYVERVCRAAALGQGVQRQEEEEQPQQQQCGGGQRGLQRQRRGTAGLAQKQNRNEKKKNLKKSKGGQQQHAKAQISTTSSPLATDAADTCRRGSRSATEGASRSSSMSPGKSKTKARDADPPRIEYKLVPTAAQRSSYGVRDRMKHPRLVGADLYVLRLGRTLTCCSSSASSVGTMATTPDDKLPPAAPPSPTPSSVSTCSTRSLHDELVTKESRIETAAADAGSSSDEGITAPYPVAESRPCYRCLSYMHAAGVKRVFWTNSLAEWEGAKVRDLIDSLEGVGSTAPAGGSEAAGGGGGGGGGAHYDRVFVTKHEVLRLVRLDSG